MSLRGRIATIAVETATGKEIFLACLDGVLCPELRPGSAAVRDNLSAHRVPGSHERIKDAGARLPSSPPYAPT